MDRKADLHQLCEEYFVLHAAKSGQNPMEADIAKWVREFGITATKAVFSDTIQVPQAVCAISTVLGLLVTQLSGLDENKIQELKIIVAKDIDRGAVVGRMLRQHRGAVGPIDIAKVREQLYKKG